MAKRIRRSKPQPDHTAIIEALAALFYREDVIELRVIYSKGKKRVFVGYFDGDYREDMANEAVRLNEQGAAVYVTLNQIDPQLLEQCPNKVQPSFNAAIDSDVTKRRWLPIDIDPVRPSNTSATDRQFAEAKIVAEANGT